MPISQCPKCELKFSSRSEMRWHLREDHPQRRPAARPSAITVPVRRPEPVREEARPSWWARTWKAIRRSR